MAAFGMAAKTAAQEEFDNIFNTSSQRPHHPEDADSNEGQDELDEERAYQQGKIADTMRQPVYHDRSIPLRLPPPSFDSGRTTGVKGVIADARSFEAAKREGTLKAKVHAPQQGHGHDHGHGQDLEKKQRARDREGQSYLMDAGDSDDEEFLEQWRQTRRKEIMREGNDIRNRRTSPSIRSYGRFDEVDALGYLDAIERVGRETVVVVFVYDPECAVSQATESALASLVAAHPAIHFVKVSYDEIEFDNAGVPAILAYRNQGDLFANLTYVVDHIPEDTPFDTNAIKQVLKRFGVL